MKKNLRGNRYIAVAADGAVDWDHPLNRGRVLWLYAPPGVAAAGSRLLNLCDARTSGTLVGQTPSLPMWAQTGRGDSGLLLSGSTQYATVPYSAALAPGRVTVACTSRLSSLPSFATAVSKPYRTSGWTSPFASYRISALGGTGTPQASFAISGSLIAATSPTAAAAGRAYRLVLTYDGATLRLYVDGAQAASASAAGVVDYGGGDTDLAIGTRSSYSASEGHPGLVSDVSVLSRAWSAAEVALDYRLSLRGYRDPDSPLRWLSSRSYSVGGFSAGLVRRQQLIGSGVY